MKADSDLKLIRSLLFVEEGPSARAVAAGRAALLERIERERRRRRWPLSSAWWAPSLGLGLLAAAAAIALLISSQLGGGAGRPASAAAAVLARAASAQSGHRPQLLPGEYLYAKIRSTYVAYGNLGRRSIPVLLTSLSEIWRGTNGGGLQRERVLGVRFLAPRERDLHHHIGGLPAVGATSTLRLDPSARVIPLGGSGITYRQMLRLPANPDVLERTIDQTTSGPPSARRAEAFHTIELLLQSPITSQLRAALYRTAARIHGIRLLGLTHDSVGRRALAIAYAGPLLISGPDYRAELLFDPHTFELLSDRLTVLSAFGGQRTGGIFNEVTFLRSGVARHLGSPPG